MRSVELFTGAGGLAQGVAAAGFRPVLMVERDKHAYETILANQQNSGPTSGWPIERADVCDIDYSRVKGDIDLVAGGPPCQPFSVGGKHGGPDDDRDMWHEAVRAVSELRPRAFFFENVRGLTRQSFAEYFEYIIERLRHPDAIAKRSDSWHDHLVRLRALREGKGKDVSYRVTHKVLNSANFGAAQQRNRVIIVGLRQDLGLDWEFPAPTHSREALLWDQYVSGQYWRRHRVKAAKRPIPSKRDARLANKLLYVSESVQGRPWVTVRDAFRGLPEPTVKGHPDLADHCLQIGARVYVGHTGSPPDSPAKALKAGDHGVPGGENMLARSDGSVRYFSVRESARLQGFPDNFVFPGSWTESMRQLGNAVPVQLSSVIAKSIASVLQNSKAQQEARKAA